MHPNKASLGSGQLKTHCVCVKYFSQIVVKLPPSQEEIKLLFNPKFSTDRFETYNKSSIQLSFQLVKEPISVGPLLHCTNVPENMAPFKMPPAIFTIFWVGIFPVTLDPHDHDIRLNSLKTTVAHKMMIILDFDNN